MGKAENRVARYVLAAKDTSATAETFGSRLKAARESMGISQKELGSRVGVFGSVIGKYEIDGGEPKASMIKKLAQALSVSTDYLLWYEVDRVRAISLALRFAGFACSSADGEEKTIKLEFKDVVYKYRHDEFIRLFGPAYDSAETAAALQYNDKFQDVFCAKVSEILKSSYADMLKQENTIIKNFIIALAKAQTDVDKLKVLDSFEGKIIAFHVDQTV